MNLKFDSMHVYLIFRRPGKSDHDDENRLDAGSVRGTICDLSHFSLDPQETPFHRSASCEKEEAYVFHVSITILLGKPETIFNRDMNKTQSFS